MASTHPLTCLSTVAPLRAPVRSGRDTQLPPRIRIFLLPVVFHIMLRYISSSQICRAIRAETTKIESFNDFLDWITFGGPIIKIGDPVEQEKQLKYATLVANSIMLSNVSDLSEVLSSMSNDGHPVTAELAAATSPYMRKNIRRFGKYGLDMEEMPAPLFPQPLPFKIPL